MSKEENKITPIGGYYTTFRPEIATDLKASGQYVVDKITDSGKFILRRVK